MHWIESSTSLGLHEDGTANNQICPKLSDYSAPKTHS